MSIIKSAISNIRAIGSSANTNITSPSVGKALSVVVSGNSGLSVASTSSFPNNPGYLLLSDASENFALISYGNVGVNKFNVLATLAGNTTTVLKSTMVAAEAEQGKTLVGSSSSFQSTSFTIQAGPTFLGTGYICILGAGGNGIFSYDKASSTLPTATKQGVFKGCVFLQAFGVAANQDPFSITVPSETIVIESSFPTPGTTLTSKDVTVVAGQPFTIDVISTAVGFPSASSTNPGYLLMKMSNGSTEVVSYTGMTATSFTDALCASAETFPTGTSVAETSNSPIDFGFKNNTKSSSEIFAAIAGEETDANGDKTQGYLTQAGSGQVLKFNKITTETAVPSFTLFQANSALGSITNLLISNSPLGRLTAFRIVFSIGKAPIIKIQNGKPFFPAASSPSDPNDDTIYDFVEFTERISPNDGVLFINTTQVDQVGIPFLMQTVPGDTIKTNGVGITPSYTDLKTKYAAYITAQFVNASSNTATIAAFQALAMKNRILNPADAITNPPGGTALPALDTYFDVALTTFFNKYIGTGNTFILQRNGFTFSGQTVVGFSPAPYSYQGTCTGASIIIPPSTNTCLQPGMQVSGSGLSAGTTIKAVSVDTNGTTVTITPAPATSPSGSTNFEFTVPETYTVLQLTEIISVANPTPVSGGQVYQIYAPYFGGQSYPANFPSGGQTTTPAAPPWIAQASAGRMVFGNLGAFADGSLQAEALQLKGTGANAQILLDVENTIVSAFNRGIANSVSAGSDVTDAWNDNDKFYAKANTGSNWSNFYAGFLHNDGVSITAPGSKIGLAYGFAYDDQGDNDPTLASISPKEVNITLNER